MRMVSTGTLSATFQIFICIGILYSFALGSVTKYVAFNVLCSIWALFHILGAIVIPESPYILLSKNKDDQAKASMKKLRDGNDDDISKELSGIKVVQRKCTREIVVFFLMTQTFIWILLL